MIGWKVERARMGFAFSMVCAMVGTAGCYTDETVNSGGTCLDASSLSKVFSIADSNFCAVAIYEADTPLGVQATTWGSHGGPLWIVADTTGGEVTLERWTAPSGATGAMTKQATHIDAKIPDGAFVGAQALDLPFSHETALSWTGPMPELQGQLEVIEEGAVVATYPARALYAMGVVTNGKDQRRLLSTGLSPIGAPTENTNGFYATDTCDAQHCGPSMPIEAWGDASGPLAVDSNGNVFLVMSSFQDGTQDARGFAAAEVAPGVSTASAAGIPMFTLPGFGSSLAAIAPRGEQPGALVFQPFDPTTYAPLDVIAVPYTTGGSVAVQGAPAPLLKIPTDSSTGLSLMTDPQDRLWVGVSSAAGVTFVVLQRAP